MATGVFQFSSITFRTFGHIPIGYSTKSLFKREYYLFQIYVQVIWPDFLNRPFVKFAWQVTIVDFTLGSLVKKNVWAWPIFLLIF